MTAPDSYGKNSGAIIDILEAMKAESAGQFDYKLTVQKDNEYGDSVNGLSTGLIKDLLVTQRFSLNGGVSLPCSQWSSTDLEKTFKIAIAV